MPKPVNRFFLRRFGTRKPSWRHKRRTRLSLTFHPARLAPFPARRHPHRGRSFENAIRNARRRLSSSATTGGKSRWVERCWRTTRHALRSEPRTADATPRRWCDDGSGSDVSLRQLPEHVDIQGLIRDQLLQPNVLGLELLQPLRIIGLHAAVLGEPPVPGRLCDLKVPAHLIQPLAGGQKPVPLSEFANNLIRRMPPPLGSHDVIPPSPKRASESHNTWTTLGGPPQSHVWFAEERQLPLEDRPA